MMIKFSLFVGASIENQALPCLHETSLNLVIHLQARVKWLFFQMLALAENETKET